jgi:pimeloyl-ACP methyl ester carboxylesterase
MIETKLKIGFCNQLIPGKVSYKMTPKPIFKNALGKKAILDAYEQILNRWPVSYESLFLETGLGTTHILASGDMDAPVLFLLHGSGSNATMWIGDVEEYSRYFRVYALDIPGEPGRSAETRPDLASSDYSDWLSEVYRRLGVSHACLTGISLGGYIALKFASASPNLLSKLVLLCPPGIAPQKVSFMILALLMMPFGDWGRERMVRIVAHNQHIHPEAMKYTKLIFRYFNPRLEKIPVLSDNELQAITMPTLLIVGEHDVMLPSRRTAARLQSLLPELTLDLLPDAGHLLIGCQNRIAAFLLDSEDKPDGEVIRS